MARRLIPHPVTYLHRCTLPMRWGEMDALGHLNNVHYFRYFEQVRISWFNSLDPSLMNERTGPLLIRTTAVYHIPIIHPATLEIKLFAGAPGSTSVTTYYEVSLAGQAEDKIYTEGEAVLVWADYAVGRSIKLPDALLQLLSAPNST